MSAGIASVGRAALLPLLLAALANCATWVAAAGVALGQLTVSASVRPDEIRVGDRARLEVVIEHPAGGTLGLPEIGRGKAVVVADRTQATEPIEGGSRERTTVAFQLTSFEIGEHPLGSGKIVFTGRGGADREAPFPAVTLRTKSVLRGDDTPMRGIKPLARWPAPLLRWALIAAGLAALGAGIAVGVRRRHARRRREAPSAPRPLPPHEIALKALAALREGKPIGEREAEPYYRELSAIVRRYVEERFGLRAPERTTEEFIREAAVSGLLAAPQQQLVREFLEQCDLVKFARLRPLPDEMARAFEAAVRLVRETRAPARGAGGP